MSVVSVLLLGLRLLHCESNPDFSPMHMQAGAPCSAGMLTIEVSGEDGPRLTDAYVVAHAGSSRRIETSTNSAGEVCIDKNLILDPAVTSITFCKDGYSCGVMLLSDIREYLPRIEYQLILLAPHAARPGTIPGSEASGLGAEARRCPESTSFEVVVQNSEGIGIPATEIRLLYEQETLVGLTDSQGIFCLARESVRGDYGLLVACHRAFFCSAVPLQDIEPLEPVELRLAKGAVP